MTRFYSWAVLALALTLAPVAAAQSALAPYLPVGFDRASNKVAEHDGVAPARIPAVLLSNAGGLPSSLSESFDSVPAIFTAGWAQTNNSSPVGTGSYFQGNAAVFPAFQGAPNAYVGVNFQSTGLVGNISNWLITPQLQLQNGTTLRFHTRTSPGAAFPDRLQVRLSTAGASTEVGATTESVGDFTTLLLEINPTLQPGPTNYPDTWTEYTATVAGLAAPTQGRFAFRYFGEIEQARVEHGRARGPKRANAAPHMWPRARALA
jgi:hypothetical protein